MRMKAIVFFRFIFFILLIFSVSSFSSERLSGEALEEKAKEETKLEFNTQKYVSSWVSMWNSYDLSLVDKLFIKDSCITYFSSEKEGLIKGINAVRKHHKGFGFVEGGKVQENKLWVNNLHTNIYGSVAVVTGVWFFRRGAEDSGEVTHGPFTFVYVQKGNKYRLAHMHFANYE